MHLPRLILPLLLAAIPSLAIASGNEPSRPVVRDHYINVTTYPDYDRRPWPMPSWETFGNCVQLVGNRYLSSERISAGGGSGSVFRPNYDLISHPPQDKFSKLIGELKQAQPKQFIWNLGGYIPDYNPGGFVNYAYIEQLKSVLGEQFLGCDIGEQDGRYVNCYKELHRLTNDRFEEHLKLHMLQQRIAEDQADKASLLTVMYNWHDMLRDGLVVSAAAECQNKGGVTSAQVQYAFLRGAARQFGVGLAGDVSVFTSWDKQRISTALRRRFLYSEYQWNCAILSCEDAYGPSPIVRDFNEWLKEFFKARPRPGPVQCPVAFLTDPFQGWMPSQSLSAQFRRSANQAYEPGDFLTHLLLSMVYPHYEDNGIWRDETRAIVPTPYGDIVEVVNSDCPAPILSGYGVIIAASDLPDAGPELRNRLETFVTGGGHLVITAANARRLWPQFGIRPDPIRFDANSTVTLASGQTFAEPLAYDVWSLDPSKIPNARPIASAKSVPLICEIPQGRGKITLLASAYGLNREPRAMFKRPYPLWRQTLDSSSDQVQPYSLLAHVKYAFDAAIKSQRLFSVGNDNLAFITNRCSATEYLIGLYNPLLTSQPFAMRSDIGLIKVRREIPLDTLQTKYPFLPTGFTGDGNPGDATHLAAGDVRFFQVTIESSSNAVRVASAPVFPKPPHDRFLRMPTLPDLERSILRWPTFFQHFDGVMLDWTQIRDIDIDALRYDGSRWFNRQRLRFLVDFRAGQYDRSWMFDLSHLAYARRNLAGLTQKLAVLDYARDLLFVASSPTEIAGLRTLAVDPLFTRYHFHVIPRTPEAVEALRSTPGPLLTADSAISFGPAADQNRDGLLLISPSAAAVDYTRTSAKPGIQVLDAEYDDWTAVHTDINLAWDQPNRGRLTGKPADLTGPAGTTASRASNLYLSLRDPGSAERALKKLNSVLRNFGGVKLESSLIWQMSPEACSRLGQLMKRRGFKVMIDFSDHLEGWTGVSFQDLQKQLKTPEIGVRARSKRVFENVAAKLPLLGATDALFVVSFATDLADKKEGSSAQVAANRATFDQFCQLLRSRGVIGHLWYHPYRSLRKDQTRKLVDATPGLRLALNLNADSDLEKGLAWAGDKLGAIVLGGGTYASDRRNAIDSSFKYEGLRYSPLSLRTDPLNGLPTNMPKVLDGDYNNAREVGDDLSMVLKQP